MRKEAIVAIESGKADSSRLAVREFHSTEPGFAWTLFWNKRTVEVHTTCGAGWVHHILTSESCATKYFATSSFVVVSKSKVSIIKGHREYFLKL